MKSSGGVAAFIGALVLLCAVVAWEWYAHTSRAPQPVRQIAEATGSPSAAPSTAPSAGSAAPATKAPSTAAPSVTPSPTQAPVVYVPQASASPSIAPSAAASAAPAATPTPYQAAPSTIHEEPMVAATVAPHVALVKPIGEPPNAPPRILSMSISTPVAHGGDVVSGYVLTTSNVASVEARIAGYSSGMKKVGVGKFVLTYKVPYLPFFLHRTYDIVVIARNTRGDAVRSSVPITIR